MRDLDRRRRPGRARSAEPIDLLLNNAGVYGPNKMLLGQIDYAAWAEVFAVNTLAPVRLAECFVEHVARERAQDRSPASRA